MFKKYQLKNGLKVLLIESHKSPVLSIQMWVKTGSADEKKGEEGISHFIEHLVFKGSKKFKVGEIAATVEAAGGELNAYTSFDQTVFHVTISKEFQNVGLEVISEMMGFPTFDPKEIDNEREVVIEEIKRSNDSPHRQASRLLFLSFYKKHPYGIPVIGYKENIETVSAKTLKSYFDGRYNPKNMTLVIAGDFSQSKMRPMVEENFGKIETKKFRIVKRLKQTLKIKPSINVKKAPFNETIVHLAFPAPKATHKDIAALEVFALVLGQGESSRLNKRLRINEHLVNFAGASVFAARDPGFFALSMSLNDKDLKPALSAMFDELDNALKAPVSYEELQKAITNFSSEQFYSRETVDGLARNYGHYQDLFDDPKYFESFMKQVQKLTPKDVLSVVKKYLSAEKCIMVVMTPASEEACQKIAKEALAEFKKKKKSLAAKRINKIQKNAKAKGKHKALPIIMKGSRVGAATDLHKFNLTDGVTLIARPSFETPVVSLRCAFLGGSRLEGAELQGSSELLSRVWTAGAGPYSEEDINHKTDAMAASLSAFGGRNSFGLGASFLTPFTDPMLELFFKTLLEPRFEAPALEREKKSMLEHIKLRQDNPAQLCVLEFMSKMFGSHPYGQDPYGTEAQINRLGQKSVDAIFAKKSNLAIVAAGAFDSQKLSRAIAQYISKFKSDKSPLRKISISYPSSDLKSELKSEKQQSHLILGYPGLALGDPQRYSLQVMQAILAGQGGRLFVELRDKASLAYSVSPVRMEGIEGGYFGAYIGCSPEKKETAIRMMKEEFKKLCDSKVSRAELERAQRYLIGKHDIELQRNSAITSSILFDHIYGIDFMETWRYGEHIRAVTSEAVQQLACKIFSKPSVLSIV